MIGKSISHYTIIKEIGRGGMGVVYKAEDRKLHRVVALKFLPPEFTRDAEAKNRFFHEAQAAAALNHTNICTVYEIDEHEDQSFISMEYVEGRSLKSMIAGGPLKLKTVLDIAMQTAAGLAEAHEKDVVHRDVKPANIMITGKGQVKIMDFGLAKLRSQTVLTKEGTTLGTVAYMSPEQACGDETDHRTDIWSIGVVFYEMISGRRPFKGEYDQAMIYSVLNDVPEPLTAVRTGVPVELERIVSKCIEKDQAERYQTAADLMADLRHLGRIMDEGMTVSRPVQSQAHVSRPPGPAPQPSEPTRRPPEPTSRRMNWMPWVVVVFLAAILAGVYIPRHFRPPTGPVEEPSSKRLKMLVVLPFENLGPHEDTYFADGITDAITARLAGLSGLGVISRQSAIQYKDSQKSTGEISEELNVDYILEGTIQRERPSDPRSRVRIIPQLIRCSDDIHLWAETYDEDMSEVFRVQSDIAERVAGELDVALLEPERKSLKAKPTENLEAYEYYLQGVEYADRRVNREDAEQSVRMFKKAVELDPDFAVAWTRLSRAYTWLYWMMHVDDALPRARAAVDEALRLDPGLLEAHLALGFIYYYGSRDYERALEQFYTVQKQRPGDAEAISAIGYIKRRQGKWEEALQQYERAIKIDPRSYMAHWDNLGNTYMLLRRYAEAEEHIDRALSLEPNMVVAYLTKAYVAILRYGDRERARSLLEEAVGRASLESLCIQLPYYISFVRINRDFTCEIIDQMNPTVCNPPNSLASASIYMVKAECCIQRGMTQEAAAFLDTARVVLERDISSGGGAGQEVHYSTLGYVYACLGLKEEAIRAGERAVEMLPISKDAFDGADLVMTMALIYAKVGEYEAAIDQLDLLLSVPSGISVPSIRLDPVWDPLRGIPRFQRMLERHAEGS